MPGENGRVPQKYSLGGKESSMIQPMSEDKQTLMNASIQVVKSGSSSMTVMKFTKIMKESGEIEIFSGNNSFLWAYGFGTSLGYHAARASFKLNLLDSDIVSSTTNINSAVQTTMNSTFPPSSILLKSDSSSDPTYSTTNTPTSFLTNQPTALSSMSPIVQLIAMPITKPTAHPSLLQNAKPTSIPTMHPTNNPTSIPTEKVEPLRTFLIMQSPGSSDSLYIETSDQYQAMDW